MNAFSTDNSEARPARTGEELVYCRNCDTPHYLTNSSSPILCPSCREEIFPRKMLLDLIKVKQAQSDTLQAEIGRARAELYFRKIRNGEKYFWEQPKPALRPARPARTPRSSLGLAEVPDL